MQRGTHARAGASERGGGGGGICLGVGDDRSSQRYLWGGSWVVFRVVSLRRMSFVPCALLRFAMTCSSEYFIVFHSFRYVAPTIQTRGKSTRAECRPG